MRLRRTGDGLALDDEATWDLLGRALEPVGRGGSWGFLGISTRFRFRVGVELAL